VLEAVRLMAEHSVGALLVMRDQELIGVISERDYARKVILKGFASSETPVRQIMTSPVTTVSPDKSVRDCMRLMSEKRFRHLPVVDRERVIGVLSIGDLVRAVLEEQQQTSRNWSATSAVDLFAPERRREQHRKGDDLDAPEEHPRNADPALEIVQRAVVGRGSDQVQSGPGVVDARDDGGQ